MKYKNDVCEIKEKLKNLKNKDLFELICDNCDLKFERTKREIQKHIYKNTVTKKFYCCKKCQSIGQIKQFEIVCKNCSKKFNRQIVKIRSGNIFCSRSCSASYNNTHKKHGTRRSKLEIFLEESLSQIYNLEMHFNRKDTINSELDIYIPVLNLAFELNGIFHYEPIYGEKKLNKIKNNDNRKFQ